MELTTGNLIKLVIHVFLGPLIALLGYIFLKWPPKEINDSYGYRTKSSMHSKKRWEFANRFSAELILRAGILTTLFQILTSVIFDAGTAVMYSSIFLIVLLLVSIYITEAKLKEKFGKLPEKGFTKKSKMEKRQ